MKPSVKRLITRLNSCPRLLRVQIKSKEARIKGIKWSLDWHLAHGGSSLDAYYIMGTEDIAREERWLVELNQKLALATN
jgi:hypothetical protein